MSQAWEYDLRVAPCSCSSIQQLWAQNLACGSAGEDLCDSGFSMYQVGSEADKEPPGGNLAR